MKRSTRSVTAKAGIYPLQGEMHDLILRTRQITENNILRLSQVSAKVGRANATIWKDVANGVFPPPISLGPRAVGWKSSELDAWIAAHEFASRSKNPIDMKAFVAQLIAPKGVENVQ